MLAAEYRTIPIVECGEPLVELSTYPFILEPVLFRLRLSPLPQIWLRTTLAAKLEQAQEKFLVPEGKRFKILDGWRPRSVQVQLYNACWRTIAEQKPEWSKDQIRACVQHHVSDPEMPGLIPSHATGGAVDLIVTNEHEGSDADMGNIHYLDWRLEHPPLDLKRAILVAENKRLLTIALQSSGLVQDTELWWHFDYGNQKWAGTGGGDIAIYGEVNPSSGYMNKATGYGHGVVLPYEMK